MVIYLDESLAMKDPGSTGWWVYRGSACEPVRPGTPTVDRAGSTRLPAAPSSHIDLLGP